MGQLAGHGHRLSVLLAAAGLARSTYYYCQSHPAHVTRPDIEDAVRSVCSRTPNGCGYRQVLMCLRREMGVRVSGKSVLAVMRRLGLLSRIRARNPWRRYDSYRGGDGAGTPNLLERDFRADAPFLKLGTDVTEFKVAGGKAYLAPVYDMFTKRIVAWDISRSPNMAQQKRLLDRLAAELPEGASPVLHTDMGWQYQHPAWTERTEAMGVRRSMSRKGNCLDNAAAEQVFGHLKDEFYRGRTFESFERFRDELDAYIRYWNSTRRQEAIGGMTPLEFQQGFLECHPVA